MLSTLRLTCSITLSVLLIHVTLETWSFTLCQIDALTFAATTSQFATRGTQTIADSNAHLSSSSSAEPHHEKSAANLLNREEPPKNLRLVFLGDSVTRYQYLSLAYFLRHGRWFDPGVTVNNLVNSHSFHHPLHPDEDWNEFFLQSNRILYPMEVCDCLRSRNGEILVERRYFYDAANNNMAVYINMNGNETHPGRGYYGRLKPEDIFGPNFHDLVGLPFGMSTSLNDAGNSASSIQWEYATWGEVIRNHIGPLNINYVDTSKTRSSSRSSATAKHLQQQHHQQTEHHHIRNSNAHVILNAGLHPHDFRNPDAAQEVLEALKDINLPGTWKTTTFAKEYVLHHQKGLLRTSSEQRFSNQTELMLLDPAVATAETSGSDAVSAGKSSSSSSRSRDRVLPHVRSSDTRMCHALGRCFNLSWTARIQPNLYVDGLHFLEPVYRIFNEDLLDQLGQLPPGHVKFDRSSVLVDNGEDAVRVDQRG